MATASSPPLLFFAAAVLLLIAARPGAAGGGCFSAIFSFGDSITDTGNAVRLGRVGGPSGISPYGRTFFGRPTGRFSDGRVILDFLAQGLGLPLVRPYLEGGDFMQGANFAVAGATALSLGFFNDKGIETSWTEKSLSIQIEEFKKLLHSLSSDPKELLNSSLILMGEIGGNDYNHPFFQGSKADLVRTFVPSVIRAISSAISDVIEIGVKTLLVPGNFPIGCVPAYLDVFESKNVEDYDPQTGCIKWLNDFAEDHNRLLQEELDRLRKLNPHVTIIYADYYGATISFFHAPQIFGFKSPLHACCGTDGRYSVSRAVQCGHKNAKVCSDPSHFVSWDGIHLTEAAYGTIVRSLLEGPHASPPLIRLCQIAEQDEVYNF